MFKRVILTFGDVVGSSFEIFAGRDLPDVYATVSELAQAVEVQPATIRAELSGSLTKLPDLAAWLTSTDGDDFNATPTSGKTFFTPSSTWKILFKDRISSDIWSTVQQVIKLAKEGPWDSNLATATKRTRPIEDIEINNDSENSSSSDSSSSNSDADDDKASLPRNAPNWIMTA
jgi:hypothetical protein